MSDIKYETAEEILAKAETAIGRKFKDIDKYGRLAKGKGSVGNVMEESFFEYSVNSRAEPDFKEAGVELKVTPYIKNKERLHAKERLVLNIINYEKEYRQTFETSSFWHKNQKLLLMFYEYVKGVSKGDLSIHATILYQYPETDLKIIHDDWEKIIAKIRGGKAHEISEGDTEYLGACTKGATRDTNWVTQPCSDIKAQRRAYCFKQPYMTYLINTYVFGTQKDENIITSAALLAHRTFEEYIIEKVEPYFGKTQEELCEQLQLSMKSKSVNERIISKILGLNGNIKETAEFKKAAIVVKTIRVNYNGRINESMSFPYFDFCELVQEEWESAAIKTFFESTRFMFVVFKYDESKILHLDRVMFWNMPPADLEEVHKVWARTVEVLKQGVKITPSPHGNSNNLPKASESPVAHVRPHGRDQFDTLPLPTGGSMPKQCFWLNNTYIRKQIEAKS